MCVYGDLREKLGYENWKGLMFSNANENGSLAVSKMRY